MNSSEAKNVVSLSSARRAIQKTAGSFKNKSNNNHKNYSNNYKDNLAMIRANDRMFPHGGTLRESAGSIGKAMEGPKYKAPVEAIKLAHKLRKKVKEGESSPFLVALLVAIAIDFADATWFIGLFCKPFLFYFLWGKGTFKVKITLRILLAIDCIPFVSWLPLSTVCVIYAWHHTAEKIKENKKKIQKIDKSVKENRENDNFQEEEYREAA